MMFFYIFLLFTVFPIFELYILIKIGQNIGAINTVLIVVFTGIFGAYLARLEGLRVFYSFQKEINEGRMPAAPLLDGFLILIGAVLLITPGVLTDILGFLLIVPFTRIFFKYLLRNYIKNKLKDRDGVIIVNNFKVDKD